MGAGVFTAVPAVGAGGGAAAAAGTADKPDATTHTDTTLHTARRDRPRRTHRVAFTDAVQAGDGFRTAVPSIGTTGPAPI